MASLRHRLRAVAGLLSSPADTWLALKTLGWMAVLPVLKRTVRLPTLVRFMWHAGDERARRRDREEHIVSLVRRLTRRSGGNCLERSLIIYRFLSRAHASPDLVIGMGARGERLGHAWVTVDGRPVFESVEALTEYTELVRFGPGGMQTAAPEHERFDAHQGRSLP